MAKKKNFMNDSFPIFTSVTIPYSYFEDNFDKDSDILKMIMRRSEDCTDYIFNRYLSNRLTNIVLALSIAIKSDRKLNKQITFDENDMYASFAYNLDLKLLLSESKKVWYDKINEEINKLSAIKNTRELFKNFPFLYRTCYLAHLESIVEDRKNGLDYEMFKNMNREDRKLLEREMTKNANIKDFNRTLWAITEEHKYADDFAYFINAYVNAFRRLLVNLPTCEKVLKNSVIDFNNLSEKELLKFELLVAASVLQSYKINNDDKLLLYVRDFLIRSKGKYPSDMSVKLRDFYPDVYSIKNASLANIDISDIPILKFNFRKLEETYTHIAKDKPYLKDFDLALDYKNKSREEILETITSLLEKMKDSYTIVSETYVKEKIAKVLSNSNYDKDEDTLNKVDSLKRKVDFLFQNKPTMLIEGKNTFTNYFGYVYKNGYVVFDYIADSAIKSYGHAIYVIKLDDLSKYSTLSLSQLKKEQKDKIITINHKGDWENRLTRIINSFENASEYIIPEELQQIDMVSTFEQLYELKDNLELITKEIELSLRNKEQKLLENISSYKQLCEFRDNSKEINKDLVKKIGEKEAELLKKSVIIDQELKHKEVAVELYPSESDKLEEDELKLLSESDGNDDFNLLYELAQKQKQTVKRNPAVSLKTKLRTKDSTGYLHCDFCGITNKSISMFHTHHIIPISEGGIDNLYNTACLCPSCHTRIHNYLRLRKRLDSGKNNNLPEGAIGEYITMSEYGGLLDTVRNRILNDTPEYLLSFEKLFNPNYSREENWEDDKFYEENKTLEDMKFSVDWNTLKRKV